MEFTGVSFQMITFVIYAIFAFIPFFVAFIHIGVKSYKSELLYAYKDTGAIKAIEKSSRSCDIKRLADFTEKVTKFHIIAVIQLIYSIHRSKAHRLK